ncbi:hypothetical protein RFI_01408 [Reticulomyxa filosa]|uniref:Kelch motif family protein n=1 Tax=Reticulomyxa filosa TaxID=46433 RepID=X6PC63_RETFI|nr:hypothetical protein RFI_01408 [Reticulomyxa filosa]|eukprot:ETO35654.1 hypothetical protein RFI_01408 [Reticulomyxa filosa]
MNKSKELNKLNDYNEWSPFTDNHNDPIIIGRDENHNYEGVRTVIGGINNHLLFITYYENNISVTFQFQKLPVCHDIAPFYKYAYVCINDVILFFGGCGNDISKSVYKYSIRENKWVTFENILHSPLYNCVAILSEDNMFVHIIGGLNAKCESISIHMKSEVSKWLSKEEMKKGIELKAEEEKEGEEKENEMKTIVIIKKQTKNKTK